MSPRAAWRLEHLGFAPVYDYAAGKADWMAAGLRTVGAGDRERRAVDALDEHPATCAPDAPLGGLPTERAVLVLNAEGVVLGRVGGGVDRASGRLAEDVMEVGPSTVRAHEPLDPLLERMAAHDVTEVVVTTPEGRLVGVVRR